MNINIKDKEKICSFYNCFVHGKADGAGSIVQKREEPPHWLFVSLIFWTETNFMVLCGVQWTAILSKPFAQKDFEREYGTNNQQQRHSHGA
jgi:hypothetical protein